MLFRSTESNGEATTATGLRAIINDLSLIDRFDVAWFFIVASVLALSPLTGAQRMWPASILGILAASVVLYARLRRRAREGARVQQWTLSMPAHSVLVVLLGALLLMAPTLRWLYGEYTDSIWRNPHGLLVAFFVVLLARHKLRQDPQVNPEASVWGFAFLIPACLLTVIDAGVRSHYIGVLGLLLLLPGLSLLLLGARRSRQLIFPLVLCIFLLPLPDGLSDPADLPNITSEIGESIVRATGTPVTRIGSRVSLASGGGIEVTQNCSGLSSFYSGCIFAILCIHATSSWPRRFALLVAPYALTALFNGIRVALLLLVSAHFGLEWKFSTPIHGLLGTASYLLVMAGIWLLSDRRSLRESLS